MRLFSLSKGRESLKNTPSAIDYLKTDRGLTDETIEHFKLGYDKDNDAIMIPIFKGSSLVNIKYRLINPTDNKYFGEKGGETWIYNEQGIEDAKKKGAILIVEGEFDLMMVYQAGITNVVSPASGKDSYGTWVEMLDPIKQIWIAYDNDKGGQETALQLADRLGTEKCYSVKYPEGFKDANEYLMTHTKKDLKNIMSQAKVFSNYRFKNLRDIITSVRKWDRDIIETPFLPSVKMEKDWLIVISARSNAGKTSYVMNIADDLTQKGIPTLVMPFERGIDSVGKRFLEVKFNKTAEDFQFLNDTEWKDIVENCRDLPLYFSLPKKDEIIETIIRSRKIFNTKFVIIDHLDYVVRNTMGNKEAEIGNTLQTLKRVAEEQSLIILIVTHIRKIDGAGEGQKRKPSIEDLKGSASLYQDPECVALLHNEDLGQMEVNIAKNKGVMRDGIFAFNVETGRLTLEAEF